MTPPRLQKPRSGWRELYQARGCDLWTLQTKIGLPDVPQKYRERFFGDKAAGAGEEMWNEPLAKSSYARSVRYAEQAAKKAINWDGVNEQPRDINEPFDDVDNVKAKSDDATSDDANSEISDSAMVDAFAALAEAFPEVGDPADDEIWNSGYGDENIVLDEAPDDIFADEDDDEDDDDEPSTQEAPHQS